MDWDNLLKQDRLEPRYEPRFHDRDQRTEFERDYDRAIFAAQTRRLGYKTQVFALEEHGAARTRLTHSLEVSTIARSLARDMCRYMIEAEHLKDSVGGMSAYEKAYAIQAIAATCALLHDAGNPPFGHAGEEAIQSWFRNTFPEQRLLETLGPAATPQMAQDFLRFEGNAHTFRLVTKLQSFHDDWQSGMNLTVGTLSALRKYVAASHEIKKDSQPLKKPGYFKSEEAEITKVSQQTGTGKSRNPIALMVEAADDIAYLTSDIEDAVRKGIVKWEQIEEVAEDRDTANDVAQRCIATAKEFLGLPPNSKRRDAGVPLVQAFRKFAIHAMVGGVIEAFEQNYPAIIDGTLESDLLKASNCHAFTKWCRQRIAEPYIYTARKVRELEVLGQHVIHNLLSIFWDAVRDHGQTDRKPDRFQRAALELTSPNYRRQLDRALRLGALPPNYCRLQMVTDYVCGMTDAYACEVLERFRSRR